LGSAAFLYPFEGDSDPERTALAGAEVRCLFLGARRFAMRDGGAMCIFADVGGLERGIMQKSVPPVDKHKTGDTHHRRSKLRNTGIEEKS
jgi:hypothetical protein